MISFVFQAGLTAQDAPDRLLIALEPEAASIYCRKLRLRDCSWAEETKRRSTVSSSMDALVGDDFQGTNSGKTGSQESTMTSIVPALVRCSKPASYVWVELVVDYLITRVSLQLAPILHPFQKPTPLISNQSET